jgi:hypothetical protein
MVFSLRNTFHRFSYSMSALEKVFSSVLGYRNFSGAEIIKLPLERAVVL